jgi:hypothetical protein
VTTRYSDMPDQPRPCRMCGADTAPGQPGHNGSQTYFDELPCERHQDDGTYMAPECGDCMQDPWYVCGSCTGEAGQQGEWYSLDEVLGTSDGPVH